MGLNKATKLLYILLASLLTIGVSYSTLEVKAASQTQSVSFPESLSQNQSKTITIPGLYKVDSISVNTGSVSYTKSGESVTINVSGGNWTSRTSYTDPYLNSKSVTTTLTSSSNSFSSTTSYNSSGYSGTISKSGSSYVYSGSYSAADSKYVTGTRTQSGSCYNDGTPDWDNCNPKPSQPPYNYNSGGYSGTLPEIDYTYSSAANPQPNGKTGFTFTRTWYYGGTVYKPAVDTRVYGQDYSGTVYQGGTAYKDYKYAYNVTINYQTDTTSPTSSITSSNTGWTQSLTLTATGIDNESGMSRIKKPDGSYVSGATATYSVTSNGAYSFSFEDKNGNVSSKTITVTNIDKLDPSGSTSVNTTAWTNQNVTISVSSTDATATSSDGSSGIKRIKLPNGSYVNSSSTTYSASSNGTYTFEIEDNAGNTKTVTRTISNVDKALPTGTLTPSTTAWTNGDVIINASGSKTGGSGFKGIKLPNGTFVNGSSASYTVSTNGTYTFEFHDTAGNIYSRSVTVDNIDKTNPNGTVSASTTSWTNQNVVLSATGSDSGVSGFRRIKLPNNTYVNASTATYTVNANGSYAFTFEDNAGNTVQKTIVVSNIDKTPPTGTLSPSSTNWTNKDVIISVNVSDNQSGVKRIELPEGSFVNDDAASYAATSNGTYTFIFEDNAGNKTTQSIVINNIDKIVPNGGFSPASNTTWKINQLTTFTPTDTGGSGVKQWRYRLTEDNGANWGSWSTYITGGSSQTITLDSTGTWKVQAQVYDNAGNVKTITSGDFAVDSILPFVWASSLSTNAVTQGSVEIQVHVEDIHSGYYRTLLPDGTYSTNKNMYYTVSQNGIYKFKVFDVAGNNYEHYVVVNNIDKTAPASDNVTLIKRVDNKYDVIVSAYDENGIKTVTLNDGAVMAKINGKDAWTITGRSNMPTSVTITDNAGGSVNIPFLSLPNHTFSSNYNPNIVVKSDVKVTLTGSNSLTYKVNSVSNVCSSSPCAFFLTKASNVELINGTNGKTSIVMLDITNIDKTQYDLILTGKRNSNNSVTVDWSPVISNPKLTCNSPTQVINKSPNAKPYTFSASNETMDCYLTGQYLGEYLTSNIITVNPNYNAPIVENNPVNNYTKKTFPRVYEEYLITGEFYIINGMRDNSPTKQVPIPGDLN